MRKIILVLLSVSLAGCVTTSSQKSDSTPGIDRKEAIVIAKKNLAASDFHGSYSPFRPQVIEDVFTQEYPDYWFVSFASESYDRSFWHYLVVLKRDTGEVRFAGPYVEQRTVDYDWIFERK